MKNLRKSIGLALCALTGAPAWVGAVEAVSPPRQIAHFDLMPKPVTLPDGTLALVFLEHKGPGLTPTPAQQSLFARYSKDNGITWGQPETLVALPADQGAFGYFVVFADLAGEIHVFMLGDARTGVIREIPGAGSDASSKALGRRRLDVWYVRSHGRRTHWSMPRMIWQGNASDLLSVTQLRSGRILLPIGYYTDRSWRKRGEGLDAFTFYGRFDVTVLYSDDGGASWLKSPSVLRAPTPGLVDFVGAVEPVVLQLDDHRVWMSLLRTQQGRFYQSFSQDGSIWSPAEPSPFLSSDSPPGLVRLRDGRIVLLWNDCLRFPYAQGSRRVLHGAISSDNGRTWHGYREVLRDPRRNEPPPSNGDHGVAYPFPAVSGAGEVVFSLWVETGAGRGLYGVDPNWLEQTEQHDDFTGGLAAWSIFGTHGVGIVRESEARHGSALRLRSMGDGWPAAAVWNFPMGEDGTLRISLRAEAAAGEFLLMLTDHFSSPFDLEDRFNSVFAMKLNSGVSALPAGRWTGLELNWNHVDRTCRVSLDGRELPRLQAQRWVNGACYLRLRALEPLAAKGELRIEQVNVAVKPPSDVAP